MATKHKIFFEDSRKFSNLESESTDLMLTSPPYPMIEMWDEAFSKLNPEIKKALDDKDGDLAFELIHKELDKVWTEAYRVLKKGGIACINIGNATRTINGEFKLYPSHSRILDYCLKIGFQVLPEILWRKQTNAPNKFMGSGMLPVGAYVTLEHEYILIMRKGGKREFNEEAEKQIRRESAYFWEERNIWFSDIWTNLNGIKQKLNSAELRDRSAAYPFELAYRLINMFSTKGDTVIDPFLGTGTTTLAALSCERNSIGLEIDENFSQTINKRILESAPSINSYIKERIRNHLAFIKNRKEESKSIKYENTNHHFPVITRQEKGILLNSLEKISQISKNEFVVSYGKEVRLESENNLMAYA